MKPTDDNLMPLRPVLFSGADAAQFLNGQLTTDVAKMAAGEWRRAAYCSRQGRMLANGLLACLPAGGEPRFVFLTDASVADDTAAALKKYVLRAKVRIEAPPAQVYATAPAEDLPPALASGVATAHDDVLTLDEGGGYHLLIGLSEQAAERVERWCLLEEIFVAEVGVAHEPHWLTPAQWRRLEISRAVPWISAQTREMFIPQFVNYELIGGVDFSKGCFVGQEVIARLHHLGEVKRRGAIVSGGNGDGGGDNAAGGDITAGATLKTAADKSIGEVVNVVNLADTISADADDSAGIFDDIAGDGGDNGDNATGFIALAALARGAADEQAFINGAPVKITPPPYPIVEQEKFKRR